MDFFSDGMLHQLSGSPLPHGYLGYNAVGWEAGHAIMNLTWHSDACKFQIHIVWGVSVAW